MEISRNIGSMNRIIDNVKDCLSEGNLHHSSNQSSSAYKKVIKWSERKTLFFKISRKKLKFLNSPGWSTVLTND